MSGEYLPLTVADLLAYYRALPKRAYGATAFNECRCLISNAVRGNGDGDALYPKTRPTYLGKPATGYVMTPADTLYLPFKLNMLAIYFDRYAKSPKRHEEHTHISAGACVRIIERFERWYERERPDRWPDIKVGWRAAFALQAKEGRNKAVTA